MSTLKKTTFAVFLLMGIFIISLLVGLVFAPRTYAYAISDEPMILVDGEAASHTMVKHGNYKDIGKISN